MLTTTTDNFEGKRITAYHGIVSGEAILGANFVKDFFASIRDVVGGRSGSYEKVLRDGKAMALKDMIEQAEELGGNAVVGCDLDYEVLGKDSSMLMVIANGTAVTIE
jgi:uncharacterized protein YbjQ (UPF0145 family)